MLASGLRSERAARLSTSSSARSDRSGSSGGGGSGGGVGGAVVVVLQLQFIDKVVDVSLQLKFQQSRVCTGSSSTECWTFQLCSERGTHSANCAEGCSCFDVPVISSDKFPQSRGSNPAPDPLSGGHSCCATDFVEIPQVQFLDKVEICPLLRRQVQFSWWFCC